MNLRDYQSVAQRRKALEQELALNLSHIGTYSLDEQAASSKNCENMIGAAQIPLGIAGPLAVNGEHANGDFFLPLATTEGALVASVSRGCKAVSASGGTVTAAKRAGQSRGPVFSVSSQKERKKAREWIETNIKVLQETASKTSQHLHLEAVLVREVGQYLFVRFSFDTEDAMGMNMVTIATEAISQVIEKETGTTCLSVAGNFDIDKKAAWLNFIENRGFAVWAEAVIKKEILQTVLKTNADAVFDVWLAKCMIGSAMSGSMGYNAHYANIIAAFFIATGQDPAHVVEGSMGITTTKVLSGGDLYFSVYLPSVVIGTVGGGTSLETQKEALEIVGVNGAGKVEKFAEIIGGAVLAGELSLLASLAQGSLGEAHEKLGRGK